VLHSVRTRQGSQRVCENLQENRKPVGFAKAYLSGFYETAVEFKGILMFLHS
jgi:hypothetical protein